MVDKGAFGGVRSALFALLRRNPKSNRILVGIAGVRPDERVLDIGCGPGAALLEASVVVTEGILAGVDPTPRLARVAAERVPGATIEVAGAEALPFPDDHFTLAWSISAYHHWPEPSAGLSGAHRVLAPGGRLLVAEWHNKRPEGHGLDDNEAASLAASMGDHGFEPVATEMHHVGRRRMVVVTGTVADLKPGT